MMSIRVDNLPDTLTVYQIGETLTEHGTVDEAPVAVAEVRGRITLLNAKTMATWQGQVSNKARKIVTAPTTAFDILEVDPAIVFKIQKGDEVYTILRVMKQRIGDGSIHHVSLDSELE